VLCLLGENGAGKSTLVNTVFGLYQPDAGQILVQGEPVHFRGSADAIASGIGMVHQHFQLIPVFTVTENVILGDEVRKGPLLDLRAARARILDLARRFGLDVDPDARVGDLSIGEQQRVELIKALFREADILILDEPTAVLTPGEVDDLFEVIRGLVAGGKSIIFITHKLREVLALADRITVLRGGRVVGEALPSDATPQTLATLMVGRDVSFSIEPTPARPGAPVLAVTDLVVEDDRHSISVDRLDLEVRAGEILGIAGVEGNGQRELVEAITGMRTPRSGTIVIDGHDVSRATPREIIDLGVAHVPEDRTKHGVVGPFSVSDNLVLNRFRRAPFARRGLRDERAIRARAADLIQRFDIRTSSPDAPVATLSGGNQQKVIIARELTEGPKLIVVAQPTRGLDVGSIEFIHRELVRLRDSGAAVLLVSAELDEVLSLSDRVGVLYRGRLVGSFGRTEAVRERIGLLMACGRVEEAATG
jgi:simple sugar transport system ATP-binding protein